MSKRKYLYSTDGQEILAAILLADFNCTLIERCPHRYSRLESDSRWLRNPDAAGWNPNKYNYRMETPA